MVTETLSLTAGDTVQISGYSEVVYQFNEAVEGVVISGSVAGSGDVFGPVKAVREGAQSLGQGGYAEGETVRVQCSGHARHKFDGFEGAISVTVNKVPFDPANPFMSAARAAISDMALLSSSTNFAVGYVAPVINGTGTLTTLTEETGVPGGGSTVYNLVKTSSTGDLGCDWLFNGSTPTYPVQKFSYGRGWRVFVRIINDSTGVPYTWATSPRRCRMIAYGPTSDANGYESRQFVLAAAGTYTAGGVDLGNHVAPGGWHEVIWDNDHFATDSGSPTKNMSIHRLRVKFESVPVGFTAQIALVAPAPPMAPTIDFQFDDCRRSVLQNAMPILAKYGYRPTLGIVSGQFDTPTPLASSLISDNASAFMTLAMIRECIAQGAVVVNHSRTHDNYNSAGAGDIPTITADFDACADFMVEQGLSTMNSELCVIFPYGARNVHTIAALNASKKDYKTAYGVGFASGFNGCTRLVGPLGAQMRINPDETAGVTLARVTDWIDLNSGAGQHQTIMFHDIMDDVNSSTIINTRDFLEGVVKHCYENGIKGLTTPEWVAQSALYAAA